MKNKNLFNFGGCSEEKSCKECKFIFNDGGEMCPVVKKRYEDLDAMHKSGDDKNFGECISAILNSDKPCEKFDEEKDSDRAEKNMESYLAFLADRALGSLAKKAKRPEDSKNILDIFKENPGFAIKPEIVHIDNITINIGVCKECSES